jgi:hypothetical protein
MNFQAELDLVTKRTTDFLFKEKIGFRTGPMPLEDSVSKKEYLGTEIHTEHLYSIICPNYRKNTVEFLVLNKNQMMNMISQGFSDKEIEQHGKVWIHLEKFADYVNMIQQANDPKFGLKIN